MTSYRVGYAILGLGGMAFGSTIAYLSFRETLLSPLEFMVPILGIALAIACLVGGIAGWMSARD